MIYLNKPRPFRGSSIQSQYLSHLWLPAVHALTVIYNPILQELVAEGAAEGLLPVVGVVGIRTLLQRGGGDVVIVRQLPDEVESLEAIDWPPDDPDLTPVVHHRKSETHMKVGLDHSVHLEGRSFAND